MRDERFRSSLPPELDDDVKKYLKNPNCRCNHPIYVKIATQCSKQLQEYYPNRELTEDAVKEIKNVDTNTFSVINCHTDELEKQLKGLPTGRKQIAISRWEDQVTVIINELDVN